MRLDIYFCACKLCESCGLLCLVLLSCSCREEMVKNVQIATVLYEVLKAMVPPQSIEEKVCFS